MYIQLYAVIRSLRPRARARAPYYPRKARKYLKEIRIVFFFPLLADSVALQCGRTRGDTAANEKNKKKNEKETFSFVENARRLLAYTTLCMSDDRAERVFPVGFPPNPQPPPPFCRARGTELFHSRFGRSLSARPLPALSLRSRVRRDPHGNIQFFNT